MARVSDLLNACTTSLGWLRHFMLWHDEKNCGDIDTDKLESDIEFVTAVIEKARNRKVMQDIIREWMAMEGVIEAVAFSALVLGLLSFIGVTINKASISAIERRLFEITLRKR